MSFLREFPGLDLPVSALGLGTVKLGRNEQVKYPAGFSLPDDAAVSALLAQAAELGINLIDTAPAYGNSEERIGQLLQRRHDWVIVTKTGEEFNAGQSHFDFSAAHTRHSVERSLKRLKTDYLDIVLIHSDGNDEVILQQTDCVPTLQQLQQDGLIRRIGMSTKTLSGGILASQLLDCVMLTWNLQQQDRDVLHSARTNNKGVLVKKGLMSGHVQADGKDLIKESMQCVLDQDGIGSMIVGTINPAHLAHNVALAKAVLGERDNAGH